MPGPRDALDHGAVGRLRRLRGFARLPAARGVFSPKKNTVDIHFVDLDENQSQMK